MCIRDRYYAYDVERHGTPDDGPAQRAPTPDPVAPVRAAAAPTPDYAPQQEGPVSYTHLTLPQSDLA